MLCGRGKNRLIPSVIAVGKRRRGPIVGTSRVSQFVISPIRSLGRNDLCRQKSAAQDASIGIVAFFTGNNTAGSLRFGGINIAVRASLALVGSVGRFSVVFFHRFPSCCGRAPRFCGLWTKKNPLGFEIDLAIVYKRHCLGRLTVC